VGDDSENPDTLKYVEEYIKPFAEDNGIRFEIINKYRKGEIETLRSRIFSTRRSIPIPLRMGTGAPGNRTCTVDFKIRNVDKWANKNRNGASELIVGLGISTDEIQRARTRPREEIYKGFWKSIEYPLIDLGLSRQDCRNIINEAGLPTPPKSSCYFCPFHSDLAWHELRQHQPDLFWDAVKIDNHLREKRQRLCPKDAVWMHRKLIPLDQAIADQPFLMDINDLDNCESGYCMT
jgi:hypothetical protein